MCQVNPFVDDRSFQVFLGPLSEVEELLTRLREQHHQVTYLAETLGSRGDDHMTACLALLEAGRQLRIAIGHFEEQRWFTILAIRQSLHSYLRRTSRLPSVDVYQGHGG
eukprot:s326_g5.t1